MCQCMLSECLKGAEEFTTGVESVPEGCMRGAEGCSGSAWGCKGMLGVCMGACKGVLRRRFENSHMLALQGQFDHSCATEGHLPQEIDYLTPLIMSCNT